MRGPSPDLDSFDTTVAANAATAAAGARKNTRTRTTMVSIFTLDESLTECGGAHQDCGPQLVGENLYSLAAWSTPRPTLDPEEVIEAQALLKENWLYRDI
jgi:hypothetical protein